MANSWPYTTYLPDFKYRSRYSARSGLREGLFFAGTKRGSCVVSARPPMLPISFCAKCCIMRVIAAFCGVIIVHKTARQKYLIDILSEKGQVTISELVDKLQVSADTLRRDLSDLEKQGLAQKNHGGAIALNLSIMNRQNRNTLLADTKQRIGKMVAEKIPGGSTLFLDAGSTVLAVAAWIQGPMTVITTSLDIAQHFSDRADIELILLGGKWDRQQRLFAGSATVSLLERYRADIAILGACALHADLGLSASQEADAEVKRAMLAASAEHWLVADHLKLNHCEPWLVAGLADIHQLFLDRPWKELQDNGSTQLNIAETK